MKLFYDNKKDEKDILQGTTKARLKTISGEGAENRLIYADNLSALKTLLDTYSGKVDLVYIDPPFATNGHFTIGEDRANTVSKSACDAIAYSDTLVGEEFLEFLRERLIFLRELLSERGSLYVHIDYKVGHYVKVLLDEVFGRDMFRNDITRIKCNPKNFHRKAYGNIKDVLFFYSKSAVPTWNEPRIPFTREETERLFKKIDKDGRFYTTIPLHAPGETVSGNTSKEWKGIKPPKGRHWRTAPSVLDEWDEQGLIEWSVQGVPRKKIFLDEREGKKMQDIWDFKDPQYPLYPTEKNLDLLKNIINASSNKGDLVLDCFAGSGTTLVAAQTLGRRWIGIDKSEHAINVIQKRIDGLSDTLFSHDRYEFLKECDTEEKECNAVVSSLKKRGELEGVLGEGKKLLVA
jgi:adenine-specific DNA-methyltransferase